jgi:hypothetical protein
MIFFDDDDDIDDILRNDSEFEELRIQFVVKTIDLDDLYYKFVKKEVEYDTPLYVMIEYKRFLLIRSPTYKKIDTVIFSAESDTTSDDFNEMVSVMERMKYKLSEIRYDRKELLFERPEQRRKLDAFEEDE